MIVPCIVTAARYSCGFRTPRSGDARCSRISMARAAPGSRGAERSVAMTVATATFFPSEPAFNVVQDVSQLTAPLPEAHRRVGAW